MHTNGIHHITAIVGEAARNTAFYTDVLGLRLVKKTVNFDDPGTYHLYFGNEEGEPGTIMTTFPWGNAMKGQIGGGQVGITYYAIPTDSLPFWKDRLDSFGYDYTEEVKFGTRSIALADPDGLQLELVERDAVEPSRYTVDTITPDQAIMGFAGAALFSTNPESTGNLLENGFGLKKIGETENATRFEAPASIGNHIDLVKVAMPAGRQGVGTVHHIAFRAADQQEHLAWREKMTGLGYGVTPVKDRNYFESIYFMDEGNILFEIATDAPGFAVDEPVESLGTELKLPPQYEVHREKIEAVLPSLETKGENVK